MSTASAPISGSTLPDLERFRVTDPGILAELERRYVEDYYTPHDAAFLKTEAGRRDIEANVTRRYEQSLFNLLPWIQRVFDLRGRDVLEIGCGTGSSTAALARVAGRVYACDLKDRALAVARARMDLLGMSNVAIVLEGAPAVLARAATEFAPLVDAVVLAAVLEHQTIPERLDTLREAWAMLRDGGVLVVYETPSRLNYMDSHTADLPFFHMLGDEIAVRYAHRSPRASFREPMAAALRRSWKEAREFLRRHGVGASHHEFELALPADGVAILADGYEPEMLALWGVSYEERLLQSFARRHRLGLHPAFLRHTLCLILQKDPAVKGWRGRTPAREISPYAGTRADLKAIARCIDRGDTRGALRLLDGLVPNWREDEGRPASPRSLVGLLKRGLRRARAANTAGPGGVASDEE